MAWRLESMEELEQWQNRNKSPARPRIVPTEDQEQATLFDWVWKVGARMHPELYRLYHIPNGGFRPKVQAAMFQKMGVQAGIPDLHLPVARRGAHSLYIELKAEDGKLSDLQICQAKFLASEGNVVAFAWGWEMARDILLWYLGEK